MLLLLYITKRNIIHFNPLKHGHPHHGIVVNIVRLGLNSIPTSAKQAIPDTSLLAIVEGLLPALAVM